jgi:tetratricopeptide (TPR) repeat protein
MLGKAALGIGIMFGDAHKVDTESVGLLNRALASLPNEDSALKAQLLAQLAVKLYLSHDFNYRSQLIDEAIAIARRLDDRDCLLFVLNSKRRALWEAENIEDRLATITEALQLAENSGNREAALNALRLQIIDLGEMGDLDNGKARISTFVQKAEELRQPYHLWEAATLTASQALFEGRYEEGERLANEAFILGQGLGFLDPGYVFAAQLAVICRDKGRLSEVANGFSEYAAQNPGIPVFRCTSAYINAELGREVEVKRDFSYLTGPGFESLPRRGVDWPVVLMLLSEICYYLGDKAQASRLYQLLLPFAERNLTSFHIVSFGSAGTSLGKLATLLGRFDDAVRHFEYALLFNERTGARPWLADTQYEYARMLLRRNSGGDVSHASQLLDLSYATAKTIESVRLVSRIGALRLSYGLNETAESTSDDWKIGQTVSSPLKQAAADSEVALRTAAEESGFSKSADRSGTRPEMRPDGAPEFQLNREGDYWTSTFRKVSVHLKHSKGLIYIQTLLSNPGREIHAMSLLGAGDPSQSASEVPGQESARAAHSIGDEGGELRVDADLGDAGEMLDATAKKAYRRRLAELNEDLVKSKEHGNVDRATELEDEIEQISKELRHAVGLMGRDRMAASSSERARVNVTRAIKVALDRIAEHDSVGGRFLSRAIRTGTFCCYLPHRDSIVR